MPALTSLLPSLGVLEVLVVVVVLLLVRLCIRTANYWERKGIFHIPPIPFVGSAPNFLTRSEYRGFIIQRFYKEARAKGQPCVGLHLGMTPLLVVVDLDLIRTVLVKDFTNFMDRGLAKDRENEPLTANLLSLEGAEWRSLRHKLTPTFTSGRMRAMFPLVQACVDELDHLLATEAAKGKPVEMYELLARFTTDVIGTCAFGIQANALKDPDVEFRVMGRKAFDMSLVQALFIIVMPRALHFFKKFLPIRLINKNVADFYTRVFQETVEHRQKNQVVRHDFVDLLMQLKTKGKLAGGDQDGDAKAEDTDLIDEDILPAQAFIFFLAGFETSSSVLGNAVTELAHNPDVQEKARAELKRVLAKHDNVLTYEALHDLTYMEQIIEETMRRYPAGSNIPRVVTQEYTLPMPGKDGKPVVLDKGCKVLIPAYALHHDPEYYPDPEKFDPERFTEEAKQSRPHYTYIPFGEGPRICIGMRFAMMQMKAGLATVLQKYRVSPVEGNNDYPPRFDPTTFVTKVLGGNKVHLHAL